MRQNKPKARFGEQRLVRDDVGAVARLLFRFMGVADPGHYLRSLYFRRELDRLRGFAPASILDAGCGAGDYSFYLARRYPGAAVLGIDLNGQRIIRNLEVARRLCLSNLQFQTADLLTAELEGRFDLVVSLDVLEHIAKQQEALARLSAALQPGGFALFHMPTVRERPVPFSKYLGAFRVWTHEVHVADDLTAEEFVARVRAAGLDVLRWYRTFGFFTGELANSLFVLPYAPTTVNKILGGLLAPLCRVLAGADTLNLERTRYAVAVVAQKPR